MTRRIGQGGIAAAALREWRRITASPYLMLMLVVFPLATGALIIALFASGAARDLPVAVVDLDQSALSRQLIRTIGATGGVSVASVVSNEDEARRSVVRGEQYGLVSIPAQFERDVVRGDAAPVHGGVRPPLPDQPGRRMGGFRPAAPRLHPQRLPGAGRQTG